MLHCVVVCTEYTLWWIVYGQLRERAYDSVEKEVAVCCSVLQCVAVRCNSLQYIAVQCVAVCCSVLQCVAVYTL